MKFFIISLLSLCTLFAIGQSKSRLTLSETQKLYDSLIVKTTVSSIPWTGGSLSQCNRGSIPQDLIDKATKRINFFRKVNGLPLVYNNDMLNPDAQEAALFIAANHMVTHAPTQDMKCFTPLAFNGCQKSCLALPSWQFHPATAFITGFIEDFGDANYYVGHRRWLLYSRLGTFGYGATTESEAIMTIDGVMDIAKFTPAFIAYPWNGYVPNELVYPKWSFSLPDKYKSVNFSKTKIIVKDESGKIWNTTIQKENNANLDPTIVWIVNDIFTSDEIKKGKNSRGQKSLINKTFYITIQNVEVDKVNNIYNYTVSIF